MGNRIYEYKQTSPAVETYYEYNSLRRPLHKHVMPADTYIYYQYDDRWNIVRVDEPTESTYFEYDAASRVTRVGYKHPTLSSYVAETFGYDALGRRTEYTPLGNGGHKSAKESRAEFPFRSIKVYTVNRLHIVSPKTSRRHDHEKLAEYRIASVEERLIVSIPMCFRPASPLSTPSAAIDNIACRS